jgi:hypothetical protein
MDSREESDEVSVVDGEELGNGTACKGLRDSVVMVTGRAKSELSAAKAANACWRSADAREGGGWLEWNGDQGY